MIGHCWPCDSYEIPDASGFFCVKVNCDQSKQIILFKDTENTGSNDFSYCFDCPIQTRPNEMGNLCISDTCDRETEVLDIDGICKDRRDFLGNSKPKENSFRTNLKLDGDISVMETAEQQE